jgi:hypothetical protein
LEIERDVLGLKNCGEEKICNLIKQLGVEIQRHKPVEWNEFLTACLGGN